LVCGVWKWGIPPKWINMIVSCCLECEIYDDPMAIGFLGNFWTNPEYIYIYYIGYQWMSRISRRGKVSGPLVVPKFLLVCLISRSCLSAVMWIVGSSLWNWTK
jgi:hypothetical protein